MRRLAPWAPLAFALAACPGPSTPTPPATPPPLADVIEAIFLGSGPLAAGDCITPGILATPLRNATFTAVIGTTIDVAGQRTIEDAVSDLQQVNNGRFRIVVERSGAADPLPGPLQITSADVPDVTIQMLCSPGGSGCTRGLTFNGASITSARCVQRIGTSPRLKAHEFGHAIGLCHVDRDRMPAAVMAPSPGTMAQDRFSALELDAIRAVYGSGLEAGATRGDFERAGLR
jgi:hypothetical protein